MSFNFSLERGWHYIFLFMVRFQQIKDSCNPGIDLYVLTLSKAVQRLETSRRWQNILGKVSVYNSRWHVGRRYRELQTVLLCPRRGGRTQQLIPTGTGTLMPGVLSGKGINRCLGFLCKLHYKVDGCEIVSMSSSHTSQGFIPSKIFGFYLFPTSN